MLGDARLASNFSNALLARGIYVIGFSYPVVPKGQVRATMCTSYLHVCTIVALTTSLVVDYDIVLCIMMTSVTYDTPTDRCDCTWHVSQARIRVQISAAHSSAQVQTAVDAFIEVGREMNIIS